MLDLATSVTTLVSTNARYQCKVLFNCSCGQPQEFSGLLFKRALKRAILFSTELGKMSTSNATPRLVWTHVILTSHGIPFTKGINSHITCLCFKHTLITPPSIDYNFDLDDPVKLQLDTSGNLYDCETEVLSTLKPIIIDTIHL